MTRASYVTPGQTAARLERMRILVSTLMVRALRRDEIADMLELSPSGVRKYVAELGSRITIARFEDQTPTSRGTPVYCLAISIELAQAYLLQLGGMPRARAAKGQKTAMTSAANDPSRHIHILADDAHYAVRLHTAPASRDPLVAAFFGQRGAEVQHGR